MVYFSARNAWYHGVIVQHRSGGEHPYTVFYEEDDDFEDFDLPDDELAFRRICGDKSHRVQVTRSMLPHCA